MAGPAIELVLGTYIVKRFARIRRGLRVPPGRDLVVGQGTQIEGSIEAGAAVHLGQGVRVLGDVRAQGDVVVGAGAVVTGALEVGHDAFILEGARVLGAVKVAGNARVVAATLSGVLECGGDAVVRGDARLHDVRAGGRVHTEARAPDPWPHTDPSS